MYLWKHSKVVRAKTLARYTDGCYVGRARVYTNLRQQNRQESTHLEATGAAPSGGGVCPDGIASRRFVAGWGDHTAEYGVCCRRRVDTLCTF